MILFLVAREPDTPVLARFLIWFAIAYLLSPIDLIPDFIPVLGILDDLLLLPLLILVIIKLIPADIWQRCSEKADQGSKIDSPWRRPVMFVIALFWIFALLWLGNLAWQWLVQ